MERNELTNSEFQNKLFSEIEEIKEKLGKLPAIQPQQEPEENLFTNEAMQMLGITSKTTLARYVKIGLFRKYRIGKKCFYRKSEIENAKKLVK